MYSMQSPVVRYKKQSIAQRSEDMKIYSSRKIIFSSDVAIGKYNFPWGNKALYLP